MAKGVPSRLIRFSLALPLIVALLLVSTCQGIAPATPAPLGAAVTTEPVEVPVTVEVTRIVMTERVVPATPVPPAPCAPASLSEAGELVVGALLPLSDPATLGSAMASQAALTLAAQEINAAGGAGGRPLRVWSADVDATRARDVVEDAVLNQCASLLLAATNAEVSTAIVEAAEAFGVPVLLLDAAADSLTAKGSPVVFRLAPAATMLSQMYGDWLSAVGDYNTDGAQNAVLVVEDTPEARKHAELIGAALREKGIGYDIYPVSLPGNDFSSLIARIVVKEQMPDAIFVRLNGDSALALQQQLLANGIGPQKGTLIVTTKQALDHERFWQTVGDLGAYTVVQRVGPWANTVDEAGAEFARRFEQILARWPEATAFAAHDALMLAALAVEKSATLEPGLLAQALEKIDASLAGGHYTFEYGSGKVPPSSADTWQWHQWLAAPLLFLQYTAPNQSSSNMAVLWPPDYATVDGPVVTPPAATAP